MHWNERSLDLLHRVHYYCCCEWEVDYELSSFHHFSALAFLACDKWHDKLKISRKNHHVLECVHYSLYRQSNNNPHVSTLNNVSCIGFLQRFYLGNFRARKSIMARSSWTHQLQSLKPIRWVQKMEIHRPHACICCLFEPFSFYKEVNGQFYECDEDVWRWWF